MTRLALRLFTALTLLIALSACQTLPHHKLHHRVVEGERALVDTARQTVLLPLSVKVKEMSTAGIKDEVGGWTEQAKTNIRASLASGTPQRDKFGLVAMPPLSEAEEASVAEHIALFNVVAGSALLHTMRAEVPQAWRAKAERFDYTLGPGLAFLADRSKADTGLILFGEDVVSSTGRKAAAFFGAALGIVVPLGHSFLIAGLVDLASGDILWLDYTLTTSDQTLRERADVDALLLELFADYPGLEGYRAARVGTP